jgi:hypothetical protein
LTTKSRKKRASKTPKCSCQKSCLFRPYGLYNFIDDPGDPGTENPDKNRVSVHFNLPESPDQKTFSLPGR